MGMEDSSLKFNNFCFGDSGIDELNLISTFVN